MLGFVFATKNEYNTFRLNISDNEERKLLGGAVIGKGLFNGEKICYALSGCGKVNAAIATTALIERYNPEGIINVGLAGAVGLDTGVYYVEELCQGDYDLKLLKEGFDCSDFVKPACIPIKKAYPDMQGAKLITTDKFITEEADSIKEKYGKCLVDMEGAAIAWVCECYNKNYYGIKIVSDNCSEEEYNTTIKERPAAPAEYALHVLNAYIKG